MDPLVSAIATALDITLQRGIEVKPMGDGWYIRVAPEQNVAANVEPDGLAVEALQTERTW